MLGLVESSEKVESEPFAKWQEELEQINNLGRGCVWHIPEAARKPLGASFYVGEMRTEPSGRAAGDKCLRSASEHIC